VSELLLADRGYDGTAIRDICAAAGCNVAAVSYHFGGKEGLYQEVFSRRIEALRRLKVERLGEVLRQKGREATPEAIVAAFTEAFIEPLLGQGDWQTVVRLFAREMLTPRLPAGMMWRELVEPLEATTAEALCSILPELDEATARLCTFCLVGQLMHVVSSRGYLDGEVETLRGERGTDSVLEHINRFTAGAIRSLAGGGMT
jgi:AcrR family transcriptional regulator